MILFIHHRYRVRGGEERAVEDLAWVARTHLGLEVEVLERDSATLAGAGAAAGLVAGGLRPQSVADAVRRTGARIIHAHNLQPTFGWRALAAAREAGARVVLHLHNYRLVCATGVCFRDGAECVECHGRNTLPGLVHGCRGSRTEGVAYAAALALWQRRIVELADAIVVPSAFAAERLRELGAPVGTPFIVPNVVRAAGEPAPVGDRPRAGALVVSRLAAEKGVDIAIRACAQLGLPLTIAGAGPEADALRVLAASLGQKVDFTGRVDELALRRLRTEAAIAIVPSRSAETFGLAAAEAMAAGLPVAASRIGALPELVPDRWLARPGDPSALAAVTTRILGDPAAPAEALGMAHDRCGPGAAADALRRVYRPFI